MTITTPPTRSNPPPFVAPFRRDNGLIFGQQLREYRHAAGLTQGELAAQARIGERTIQLWETGAGVVPQHGTLERLASAFDLGGAARAAFLALAVGARTAVGAAAHNLPAPRTAFIGRASSQRAITRLLTGRTRRRLVTLVGPGGVGKTRLALQSALPLRAAFPDDIWFVDLVGTAGITSVADTIAATLGVRDRPGQEGVDTLIAELCERRLLLILDNCEHLRAPVAALAKLLLDQTSGVQILATSREALGLAGEVIRRVAPLPLPEAEADLTPDELARSEAAQLFCARAVQADPAFAVTPANAATIATLCARLDGLPLLLELVAAQLSTHPLATVAADVAEALHFRQARRRGGAARQRDVRALLDWSHALLTPDERTLLRRLAPFAAGWTRGDARGLRRAGATRCRYGARSVGGAIARHRGAGGRWRVPLPPAGDDPPRRPGPVAGGGRGGPDRAAPVRVVYRARGIMPRPARWRAGGPDVAGRSHPGGRQYPRRVFMGRRARSGARPAPGDGVLGVRLHADEPPWRARTARSLPHTWGGERAPARARTLRARHVEPLQRTPREPRRSRHRPRPRRCGGRR